MDEKRCKGHFSKKMLQFKIYFVFILKCNTIPKPCNDIKYLSLFVSLIVTLAGTAYYRNRAWVHPSKHRHSSHPWGTTRCEFFSDQVQTVCDSTYVDRITLKCFSWPWHVLNLEVILDQAKTLTLAFFWKTVLVRSFKIWHGNNCYVSHFHTIFFFFLALKLSLVGNLGHLTWVDCSSHKISATHSYQCVWYFRVSKERYGCQCFRSLTCAQMLVHAIAHGVL